MPRRLTVLLTVAAATAAMCAPSAADSRPVRAAARASGSLPSSVQLATTTRLAERRSFVIGTRFYEAGAEDGSYPAEGFHTRGEMGGFWSMPIKLLDGVWFAVNGTWLSANRYATGRGYARMAMGEHAGVRITRTDVVPDGLRAGLVGLTLTSAAPRTIRLTMDAHSELMSVYPWGQTTPNQLAANLPDTGAYRRGSLVFRDRGTPPVPHAGPHDWTAVVGSRLTPSAHALGANFRGPQSGDVVCPPSDSPAPEPARCDDTAYGKGTGGSLTYRVHVPAGSRTVWFSVAGSDRGPAAARHAQQVALAAPVALLRRKIAARRAVEARTSVRLPGNPLLARSVSWSKQNLADSRQVATGLRLRVTHAGTAYPAPVARLRTARWIGAGWPDYPWIFGTDGEYTAFAAVAAGQFTSIEDHLRTLMRISDRVNRRSGKVIHETTPDGSVFFGANGDPGNTDETVKFPSAVALVWRWTGDNRFRDQMYDFTVRNLHYAFRKLDTDRDGWLEGSGNVERTGMGEEKLDNTVYAIRGLLDLADMAASKGDVATLRWVRAKARSLQARFERAWWYGRGTASYADSLKNPGNHKLFQRYWIGLTPVEAELPARGAHPAGPLATPAHARATVARHQAACFTGRNGLYHTGTGPSADTARGSTPPSCDRVVSAAPADREIFTLTTSIAAVAEAALGRAQVRRYTGDLARVQLSPSVWEVPGMMPEISPSPTPDFGANIDKPFTQRSSGLQAWGTYGVLWPVVHFELGVRPDLGRGLLSVVPKLPGAERRASATDVNVGTGSVDVSVGRSPARLSTTVLRHVRAHLTVGAVLPAGTHVTSVRLNGRSVRYTVVASVRGRQVLVDAGRTGDARLVVRTARG